MRVEPKWRMSSLVVVLCITAALAAPPLLAQKPAEQPPTLQGEMSAAASPERPEQLFLGRRDCCERTRYQVLVAQRDVEAWETPFGPGYEVAFDEVIDVKGYSEIRLWVHVFVNTYEVNPVTSQAELNVRFLHQFPGGSFDYEKSTIGWNNVTSYINGYVVKPIIGDEVRVLCNPKNLPPGPYNLYVTYLLVR